ncbi:lysophospholipid acyltransferase family protein [Pseudactinotalea suaedae]
MTGGRPRPPWVFRAVVAVLRPLMRLVTRPRWRGAENLPDGPFIIVANHISVFDPFTLIHFLVDHDVWPAVLAKDSLWRYPVVGWVVRQVRAVPVHRGSAGARGALAGAETAIAAGYAVLIFPEGTTTQDPDIWPMRAKTGAARLALRTGAAVVPIAQWGAHEVIPVSGKGFRPFPRTPSDVVAGPPVDLSDLVERADDPAAWEEATTRMMARITAQLAGIRGEAPPAVPFVGQPLPPR